MWTFLAENPMFLWVFTLVMVSIASVLQIRIYRIMKQQRENKTQKKAH